MGATTRQSAEVCHLVWQQPAYVQLAGDGARGCINASVVPSRSNVHLAVCNSGHRKLHRVSGRIPGFLCAVPQLCGYVRCVICVKNFWATAIGLWRPVVPVVQRPIDSVEGSGRRNRWRATRKAKAARRLWSAGEIKHVRHCIKSVALEWTVYPGQGELAVPKPTGRENSRPNVEVLQTKRPWRGVQCNLTVPSLLHTAQRVGPESLNR
jgi:hypothetical protein